MVTIKNHSISIPVNLCGRSIHQKVIPTVCNLKNMLDKLISVNGDVSQLKQWERRSYIAYQIEKIKPFILTSPPDQWKHLIKQHILNINPNHLGASCIDIYLVAYVAENFGPGKARFFQFIRESGISEKPGSAQAIWQVGKGDGVYLGLLYDNGSVKDWDFFERWIKGEQMTI